MKTLSTPDHQTHRLPVTVASKGLFSSRTNEWATPLSLFQALNNEFHFDVDVAARSSNAKCKTYFTKSQNGLLQDWYASSQTKAIFCNPPFQGQTGKWVEKAYHESQKGCTVVVLIPFRTDTGYIHDYIIGKAFEVRLIKGRLNYNDGKGKAPFPSSIIIFKKGNHHTKWRSVDTQNHTLSGYSQERDERNQWDESITSNQTIETNLQEISGIVSMTPEITYNTNRTYSSGKKAPDGIELRFGNMRPTPQARELLKAHGFQFSEKQTLWYALDNEKSRALIQLIETNQLEADDTQYEKRHFWARVSSVSFYDKLSPYTEFMVSGTPPQFFYSKYKLEKQTTVPVLINKRELFFKKFYNKVIGGEDQSNDNENENESENEKDTKRASEKKQNTQNEQPDLALADKLEALASGLQKQIDAKLHPAIAKQNPTRRRMQIAASMRSDGYYLQNIQTVLYALSKAHRTQKIKAYGVLKNIRTRAQVELLNKFTDRLLNKETDHYLLSVFKNNITEFSKLEIYSVRDWEIANQHRLNLLEQNSDTTQDNQAAYKQQLDQLEIEIKSLKIDGFFPTPKPLIHQLLNLAELKKGENVLEPSAGKGDILDAIREKYGDTVKLSACEVNTKLSEFLKLKGYKVVASDFLTLADKYDKIIMNPPFENGKDIDHVLHAYSVLKKGGRLVAIMSEGVFFRKFKKDIAFREFLFETNAYVSEKIEGAFKKAFNQTGIAVRLVVINEDHTLPEFENFESDYSIPKNTQSEEHESEPERKSESESESETDLDDMEILELEALAEMELLKMELELKKKKNKSSGLSGTETNRINNTITNSPEIWDFK